LSAAETCAELKISAAKTRAVFDCNILLSGMRSEAAARCGMQAISGFRPLDALKDKMD
jgi:hypothetical protein